MNSRIARVVISAVDMSVLSDVVTVFHCNCVLSGYVHTRSLFGEDNCYIMDAKSVGNLGRYLNVSKAFC